jgi:ACS family hexuronate transporter-like MFS transporter
MYVPFPNHRRWTILGLIFVVTVLSYLDRQIVSIIKPTLKTVFGTDDQGYAVIINVFTVCYAVSYPVSGWLVDRLGSGRVMLAGIVVWSTACIGSAFSRTLRGFTLFRAVLGLSEPTTFPAQLRIVAAWFPPSIRATAYSICAAGGTVGAIVAPPIIGLLAIRFGWRAAFLVPGVAGMFIAVLWRLIYSDPPQENAPPATGPAHNSVRWSGLWRQRGLWGVLLCRFIGDPVWYFCLFWLPGYLQEQSGLTLAQVARFGWIPFLIADLGGVGSSIVSDWLVKKGIAPLRARKLVLTAAAFLAPVSLIVPLAHSATLVIILFCVIGAVSLTWLFGIGVIIAEVFPLGNVGSVTGIAGAAGAIGAMFFNAFVGKVIASLGAMHVFWVMATLQPMAVAVLWTLIRSKPQVRAI